MAQRKEYTLMLFDEPLATFAASTDQYGRFSVDGFALATADRNLLPMRLLIDPSGESLAAWLSGRVIPKNRRFVNDILAAAGLTVGDTMGIIDVCRGLSVNDSYWIDDSKGAVSFSDINLFDNPLDTTLSIIAYTGYTSSRKHKLGLSTEWTTSGQFAKAWRRLPSGLVLFKSGSDDGFANDGMEPYSEYFASQLLESMGIEHVPYGLERWKSKLASTCPLMNTKDVSLVSFYEASAAPLFPSFLAVAYGMSPESFDGVRSMLVFDALACNTDRHAANFGVLRDNATGMVLGLAPLYDHNLSLFARDMPEDYPNFAARANTVMMPALTSMTFLAQSGIVMGELQHEQLRRVLSFELENHPLHAVDESRLAALNAYLQIRVRELLDIPVVDERSLARDMERELEAIRDAAPIFVCTPGWK